jgi:hypothetical protein
LRAITCTSMFAALRISVFTARRSRPALHDVVRVFVSQLRKEIEPEPIRPQIILTDPGIGYRWTLQSVTETSHPV